MDGALLADPAGPGMFAQSDPAAIRGALADAGFADITPEPHTLPLYFGTTVAEAVDYLDNSGTQPRHPRDHPVRSPR